MVRLVGVDLPRDKRIEYALTYIYGIGLHTSRLILNQAQIDSNIRTKDLNEEQVGALRTVIEAEFRVVGDLRRQNVMNIKRLMEIRCVRGRRHKSGLPVRGQRTRTNSRTKRRT
jgi:small subunit ribosomal protein S13